MSRPLLLLLLVALLCAWCLCSSAVSAEGESAAASSSSSTGFFKSGGAMAQPEWPGDFFGFAFANFDYEEYPPVLIAFGNSTCNCGLAWDGAALASIDYDFPEVRDCKHQSYAAVTGDFTRNGKEEMVVFSLDPEESVHILHNPRKVEVQKTHLSGVTTAISLNRESMHKNSLVVSTKEGLRAYDLEQDNTYAFNLTLTDVTEAMGIQDEAATGSFMLGPFTTRRSDLVLTSPFRHFKNGKEGKFDKIKSQFPATAEPSSLEALFVMVDLRDDSETLAIVEADRVKGNRLWRWNEETSEWEDIATGSFKDISNVQSVCASDFDNDGYMEVFFNNHIDANRLFKVVDGNLVEIDVGAAAEPGRQGTGCAVADFDQDGFPELVLSHRRDATEENEDKWFTFSIYRPANKASNRGIRFLPYTRMGAPARGTRAILKDADGNVQVRQLDAHTGQMSAHEPVFHFGVGDVDSVEYIEYMYTTGLTRRIGGKQLPLGRVHSMSYPTETFQIHDEL